MKFVYIVKIRFSARGTLFTQTSIKVRRLTGGLFIYLFIYLFFFEKQRNERNRAALIITSPLTSYEDLKLRASMRGDQWASSVIECSWVYCKIETSPWAPKFQKRLNCLLLIGQKKNVLANQRREAAGWLSCFLTRRSFRHRRKFQNKMLTTRKIATCSTATRNKHSPMNF